MTDDDRDLAERAALAMGWSIRGDDGSHYDQGGNVVPPPSLADAAFCWAMLCWLYENLSVNWARTLMRLEPKRPREDWPAALARAVIADKEEA